MVKIFDANGNAAGDVKLPGVFSTPYKPAVIKRAVLAEQSQARQPYGSDVLAGKRTSAHYHGKRKYRFSMMNKELSRIPRIHGKGAGYMTLRARFAPHAVKGRQAHPPKADKVWAQKINKKERALAIKSALAATSNAELVRARGHIFDAHVPIIIDDFFEDTKKTKDVSSLLGRIMRGELERCGERKVRAGRGKMRGRRYRKKTGPLIIVSKKCPLLKTARNIPGVDVAVCDNLSAGLLAPGTHAGRLSVFTKASLGKIGKIYK